MLTIFIFLFLFLGGLEPEVWGGEDVLNPVTVVAFALFSVTVVYSRQVLGKLLLLGRGSPLLRYF